MVVQLGNNTDNKLNEIIVLVRRDEVYFLFMAFITNVANHRNIA